MCIRDRYITFLISSESFKDLSAEDYQNEITNKRLAEYSQEIDVTGDGDYLLRYFDSFELELEDAYNFCSRLPGLSKLYNLNHTDEFRRDHYDDIRLGAIGKHIFGKDGLGSKIVWKPSSLNEPKAYNVTSDWLSLIHI